MINYLCHVMAGDELNNLDLYVVAPDYQAARRHWLEYYGLDADDQPARIFRLCETALPAGPRPWKEIQTMTA